eukprot:373229-Pelagomonas_calceolata.AAC.3
MRKKTQVISTRDALGANVSLSKGQGADGVQIIRGCSKHSGAEHSMGQSPEGALGAVRLPKLQWKRRFNLAQIEMDMAYRLNFSKGTCASSVKALGLLILLLGEGFGTRDAALRE